MVVTSDPAKVGQKELRRDWPVEDGIIAGTTKTEDNVSNLVIQKTDLVLARDEVGI